MTAINFFHIFIIQVYYTFWIISFCFNQPFNCTTSRAVVIAKQSEYPSYPFLKIPPESQIF